MRQLESQDKARLAARAALNKQATDVVVLDLRALSTVTDFFVICTVDSTPQLAAIRDDLDATLAQHGATVWHTEGASSSGRSVQDAIGQLRWLLLDCGDVVVHVLDQRSRAFYRLEELWADAPRVAVSA